jgi:LacI family transcriptional regulator
LLRYERGEQLPTVHAPRPYAHPVHTLAGVPLTASGPRDHRHQHGLSLAVADVNGTTYWGGRTYVRELGSTLLANHGRQRVVARTVDNSADGARLIERLSWEDEYGDTWLREDRVLEGRLLGELAGWSLGWRSRLRADESDVTFSSPAVVGRHGAGYGGIFWRFEGSAVRAVYSAAGEGEAAVHGRRVPWVAMVRDGPHGSTTVILRQPAGLTEDEPLPWFCRVSSYVGMGPAIAWDRERKLRYGATLRLGLDAILLDREVSAGEVPEILSADGPGGSPVCEGEPT